MRSFLAPFLLFSLAFAAPLSDEDECGSHPSEQEVQNAQSMYLNVTSGSLAKTSGGGGWQKPKHCSCPIEVYWHVVMAGNTYEEGNVPQQHIEDAMDVINHAYSPGHISFKLAGTTRTTNAVWFNTYKDSPDEEAMKSALHQGNEASLNVYLINFANPGLLGHAKFPWEYFLDPLLDGIVVRFNTLPGGSNIGYNYGITFVHEAGHWLGVFHTFQGGCDSPGDYVDDTAPEGTATSGCPIGTKDTCPGGGPDPVTNYMDYSAHTCKDNFTPGQYARMKILSGAFRGLDC